MPAYYNEIDPFAAAWLRKLISEGHICPGEVDERSIVDVRPSDLSGFDQCHFFAGIGVWSYALRLAGWPDDRPAWTGSCPCQPFSAAGKGNGFDDERHLWPSLYHLIRECQPPVWFGEQVASKDGLAWLDLVQADLEGAGYACGAVDLCVAGVGAPHIRQRLWPVAERLANAKICGGRAGLCDSEPPSERRPFVANNCGVGRLVDHGGTGLERRDARSLGGERPSLERNVRGEPEGQSAAGPTNGLWRDADWLFCRDGKWRPVEPGTFPLVDGAPARVGRLRGYGNAINAASAAQVIRAYIDVND